MTHYRKLGLSGLVVLDQRVLCTAQREELGGLSRRSLEKSSFRLLETWEEETAVTDFCTPWSLITKTLNIFDLAKRRLFYHLV